VAAIKSKIRWLILGANGQLGQALQEELISRDIEYITRSHSQLDITNEEGTIASLKLLKPDVVVNAAAWTNVNLAEKEERLAFSVNGIAPAMIASQSRSLGFKFIHISTDYVFSGNAQTPWQEDQTTCPATAYGRSKAEGERLIAKSNSANSYIIRTAWLYSRFQNNFAKTMIRLALGESKRVEVVNDQLGQPTYAIDLAAHITKLIELNSNPGTYHGTNAGQTTWYQFARELFSLAGADPDRVIPVRSDQYSQPAQRPTYSVLGHERWSNEGMKPMRHWKDALADAFPAILSQVKLERL
jgi:dTDP-4-dehydrorhamnose reductase